MAANNGSNASSNPPRLQTDPAFEDSYARFTEYPKNLIHQSLYPGALEGYISRLDQNAAKLFSTDGVDISFRDYTGPHSAWDKRNVSTEDALKDRLGDLTSVDPYGPMVTKKDPNCRFILFSGTDSRSPLNLRKEMLLRILTYHQVMSGFLDFLFIFGMKNTYDTTRDLRYSGFREKTMVNGSTNQAYAISQLGRSGRQFELCYNLKSVVCKTDATNPISQWEWAIRQGAFYHKFDVETGSSLWIVTEGRRAKGNQGKDVKRLIQELVGPNGRPEDRDYSSPEKSFYSNLSIHLLVCYWSVEQWRWYIEWLEDVVEELTERAIHECRLPGERGKNYGYTTSNVQSVQHYEDKLNEAIMVLETNSSALTSLHKYYQKLLHTSGFHLQKPCKEDIIAFARKIDEMVYDLSMNIKRAKVLLKITTDRKNLILQHLQNQAIEKQSEATEKMERLTISMHTIGRMAQKEAIAMRIVTVVTLIFLPATFVSVSLTTFLIAAVVLAKSLNLSQTLFSTDIIKYQDPGNSSDNNTGTSSQPYMGSFSKVAMDRWLEVSLPLTALTLLIGFLAFVLANKRAKDRLEKKGLLPIYEVEDKSC